MAVARDAAFPVADARPVLSCADEDTGDVPLDDEGVRAAEGERVGVDVVAGEGRENEMREEIGGEGHCEGREGEEAELG